MSLHTIQLTPRWQPAPPVDESRSTGRLWLAIAVVGIGLMLAYSDPNLLKIDAWDGGIYAVDEQVDMLATGSWTTKVAVLSLGIFGVYLTFCRSGWHRDWNAPILLTAIALMGWGALSIFWSSEPDLTMRRYIALLCICAAGVGLTRQLTPRELVHFVVGLTCLWIGVGLASELAVGKFRPWESGYRFSGLVHPNTQGVYGALLLLGALAELSLTPRYRTLWLTLAALAICVLIVSKSRTATVSLIAALSVLCVLKPDRKRIMAAMAAGALFCAVLVVGQFASADSDELFEGLASMGREDASEGLTGRVPLWNELTYFIGERPILGYGYGAFWNVERTDFISGVLYWTVPSAHSAYFEAMLDLGLCGVLLLVLLLLMVIGSAANLFRQIGTPATGFLLALVVFLAIGSFTESELVQASVICLLGSCGVLQIAGRIVTEPNAVKLDPVGTWVGNLRTAGRAY